MQTRNKTFFITIGLLFLGLTGLLLVSRIILNLSAPDTGASADVKANLTLISPSSVENLSSGADIVVGYSLENAINDNVSEIVLTFDPSVLTAKSITEDENILTLNKFIDNNIGKITVDIASSGSGDFSENVNLVKFTFTLKNLKNTSINVDSLTTIGFPNELTSDGLGKLQLKFLPTSYKVNITSPQSGESWNIGESKTISWSSTLENLSYQLKVQISRNNGESYSDIITPRSLLNSEYSDGNLEWKVTGPSSAQSKLKIILINQSNNTEIIDESDNFTIANKITTSISGDITSPNNSNNDTNTLPNTAIIDNSFVYLIGFLFIILGLITFRVSRSN